MNFRFQLNLLDGYRLKEDAKLNPNLYRDAVHKR